MFLKWEEFPPRELYRMGTSTVIMCSFPCFVSVCIVSTTAQPRSAE